MRDARRTGKEKLRGSVELKRTGPVLRWPSGRALYLWDSEGNYIELESPEDLPTKYGIEQSATK